ncbi:glycosyltransferase family 4 protein [Mycobacterium sp.]|uniref:glycosyltransferase family 4 protein n=1 Tax=Mycobacterium sp. TaxID=1785 RepID=UPI0025D3A2CB|nr:glycosyltransferase family 4 protein [Mycobacterium sp.]
MTAQLRIALIASSRYPISQPFAGGLEAHVWHLSRALAGRGHEVSVFAAPGSDRDLDCRTLAVRHLVITESARADASMSPDAFMADHHAYLTLMMQLAAAGRGDFDIIHNHSLHYLPVAMASMVPIPMLTTVHTPPTPWLESAIDASGGVGTQFAAVSAHTAELWRGTIPQMTVVPNGIDPHRWPLGAGGGPLLWFGRITAEKAPHLAIAVARRAGRSLELVGPISDPRYFEDQVQPHLNENIRYSGHLDQGRLATVIGRASAVLVTPMWDEPYGLVVAEAMCCGTPVVAFARGGIPELVVLQSGRLVAPGDVEAMAAAIPDAIRLPRPTVRDHALRHCSSEAMVSTYLRLYRKMLEHREDSHDRLLHTPPGLRSSGSSDQHLRTAAIPDDSLEFDGYSRAAPVRRSREATA